MQDLLSDQVFFGQAVQTLITVEMRPDFLVVARKFCHRTMPHAGFCPASVLLVQIKACCFCKLRTAK